MDFLFKPFIFSFTIQIFYLMRKSNLKALLLASFAAFFLVFTGAEKAGAQTGLADGFYSVPTGNFVSPGDAQLILSGQINTLKTFLLTLVPGSPVHKTTLRAVNFYNAILQSVNDGKQVPVAIADGTHIFTGAINGEATKAEKKGLKQQAVDLLAN
jgi:hypothetical protein